MSERETRGLHPMDIVGAVCLAVLVFLIYLVATDDRPPYQPCKTSVINGVNCVVCRVGRSVDCDWRNQNDN